MRLRSAKSALMVLCHWHTRNIRHRRLVRCFCETQRRHWANLPANPQSMQQRPPCVLSPQLHTCGFLSKEGSHGPRPTATRSADPTCRATPARPIFHPPPNLPVLPTCRGNVAVHRRAFRASRVMNSWLVNKEDRRERSLAHLCVGLLPVRTDGAGWCISLNVTVGSATIASRLTANVQSEPASRRKMMITLLRRT